MKKNSKILDGEKLANIIRKRGYLKCRRFLKIIGENTPLFDAFFIGKANPSPAVIKQIALELGIAKEEIMKDQ